MAEIASHPSKKFGTGTPAKRPSRWWVAVLVVLNFLVVEIVFVVVGVALTSGEGREVVGLDAIICVPPAFVMSLLLLIPILRTWQLRDPATAALVGSWLPGVVIGVLFYWLGMYTNFFQMFVPIARLLE